MNPKYPSPYEHITHAQQFDEKFLLSLFSLTKKIKDKPQAYKNALSSTVVAALFYEPSTRTRLSFESAVHRMGGCVITTENAAEFSSAAKGETIEDSVRVVSGYADFIVMRHYEDDASKRALATTRVPLINAGSGKSQHPTQALLDVYTIYERYGRLTDLHIVVTGDLRRGRTCDSLVYLLSKFQGNAFTFVSPKNCQVKESLKKHLNKSKVTFAESESIQEVLEKGDIFYITRIQKERFHDKEEYEAARGSFILDMEAVKQMKQEAIIMHPLPRVDEIAVEVDEDSRALYFTQAENGLYVRMALLKILHEHRSL